MVLPTPTSSTLAIPQPTGLDAMEPKLLAVLQNCDVSTASIQEIAKSVKTAALFGSLGNTEAAFEKFIKMALTLDT